MVDFPLSQFSCQENFKSKLECGSSSEISSVRFNRFSAVVQFKFSSIDFSSDPGSVHFGSNEF